MTNNLPDGPMLAFLGALASLAVEAVVVQGMSGHTFVERNEGHLSRCSRIGVGLGGSSRQVDNEASEVIVKPF